MESKVHPILTAPTPTNNQLPPLNELQSSCENKEKMTDMVKYMKAARIIYKSHTKPVVSLGVLDSHDEHDTFILSGSEDKTLKVWSLRTGQLITSLSGHKQRISGVVGYANSNKCPPVAVTSSWDETMRIWPLDSCYRDGKSVDGTEIYNRSVPLTGFKNRVLGIALVCPEKSVPSVAGCSADNTIQVFKLPKGEPLYVLEDKDEVSWNMCMASWFIPKNLDPRISGPILLSGTKTNILRIWNAKPPPLSAEGNTKPDKVIRGAHSSAIHKIGCFDYEDLPHVVTICRDLDIRIFSILSGELLKTLKGHTSPITDISAHDISTKRGGAIIVSSSSKGNMRVWKYSTGELMRVFNGHTEEIAAVTCFKTPEPDKDDLVIVSGSKDYTARTWLFAEEKNLKVLSHRAVPNRKHSNPLSPKSRLGKHVRVNALDVYTRESFAWIVTGSDDGTLRCWSICQDDNDGEDNDLVWLTQGHDAQILAVNLYVPLGETSHSQVIVISSCREGMIRVSKLEDGSEVYPLWKAHDSAITSLHVFPGKLRLLGEGAEIKPFLVSGSDDNTAKVWSLDTASNCLHVLEGHEFDVKAVTVFFPRTENRTTKANRIKGNNSQSTSMQITPRASFIVQPNKEAEPIIITASVDCTVCLWSYSTGELLQVLEDSKTFVTSLTVLDPKPLTAGMEADPILAAGNGDGEVFVWSLKPPYRLKHIFQGHMDEVAHLSSMDVDGMFPVLVSGSLDTTIRVWDLRKLTCKTTIEGHTADVMAVKIFKAGDNDPALSSASCDGTVRVLYDFLGSVPNIDVVIQQFKFDLGGVNNHVLSESSSSRWPRISSLVLKEGPDNFFGVYYMLFGKALRSGRSDFLVEFLPQTRLGLLKSNSEMEDGDANDSRGSILRQAIEAKDTVAVRVLIECWCNFLTTPPVADTDLIYDVKVGQISRDDALLLAEVYPAQFEQLICSIKPIPVRGNKLPINALYLFSSKEKGMQIETYWDESKLHKSHHGRKMVKNVNKAKVNEKEQTYVLTDKQPMSNKSDPPSQDDKDLDAFVPSLQRMLSSAKHDIMENVLELEPDEEEVEEMQGKTQTFLFLPINGAVHMDIIKAYTETCESIDSVEIFNSEAGQLALSYAWRTFGIKAHLTKFGIYLLYVAIATVSTLTFNYLYRTNYWYISLILIIAQLLLNLYFVRSEAQQYLTGILEYLQDIWNFIDFSIIMFNTSGNVIRLIYWKDVPGAVVTLSFSSVFIWFNILYYLRAFESTGPLVSMILRIANDMKYLIFVVLLVLVGFSQAFWLISEGDADYPFGRIDHSLLNSFSFMLGNYDPEGFAGLHLESFAQMMAALYMLIVSILLLNLLIALMGDSYSQVKEKGLAQWKYEQARIITEMAGSMSKADRNCEAIVYLRKRTDDLHVANVEEVDSAAVVSEAIENRLQKNEAAMEEMKGDIKNIEKELSAMASMQEGLIIMMKELLENKIEKL